MTTINWSALAKDAEAANTPLPIGNYDVEVSSAEHKIANSGNTMFKLTLSVLNGPHKGRKIWTNKTIATGNPNAIAFFFKDMKTLGLGADFFAGLDPEGSEPLVCQALVGKRVNVSCKHREYNGSIQVEVETMKVYEGSDPLTEVRTAAVAAPSVPF